MGLKTKKFKVIWNNILKKKRASTVHIPLTEALDDRLSGNFASSALNDCVKEARKSCGWPCADILNLDVTRDGLFRIRGSFLSY